MALVLEYGFDIKGCFFCWVQRWWLLLIAIVILKGGSWRFILTLVFFSCTLGLYHISLISGQHLCATWGGFLPASIFSWLMQFPQCDLSGYLNVPWVVWLTVYQAMVLGYCLRRCADAQAI